MRSRFGVVAFLAGLQVVYGLPDFADVAPLRRASVPIHLNQRKSLSSRALANGLGIQSLTGTEDKQSYYAVIQAGNINFRVALDTGSSDLWLSSSSCTTKTCTSVPRYPLAYHSPSFVSVNGNSTAFSTHFADGTGATGFVARETVTYSNLTLANQALGVVTNSNVTLDDDVSGILGLGFPRLSSISNSMANATPFFSTLAQQGLLDYPLFGLSLTRNISGTLTLGAIDSSVVTNLSNVVWNPVVPFSPFGSESNTSSYLQWAIRLSNFAVNGTAMSPIPTYPNATGNSSIALLDIGSPGIYGPYQDVSRIFAAIPGSRLVDLSGQWALPCDSPDTLSFTFGHQNFTLQPSDYLIGPTSGDPNYCLTWPMAAQPSSDGIDWQLGSAFLRTVYSVFSYGINTKEVPMIGLYPLRPANATIESPEVVSSFFASASATVATTLPNFPLSTPSYTTPPYAFNTSVPASVGQVVSSGLANSTYSAVLGTRRPNITALPTVAGVATMATLVLTDSSGLIHTSTSAISQPSVTLGTPPGWSAAAPIRIPVILVLLSCIAPTITLVFAIS